MLGVIYAFVWICMLWCVVLCVYVCCRAGSDAWNVRWTACYLSCHWQALGTCGPAVIQMDEFVMDTHRGYTCMAFSKIPTKRCTLHCLFNACAFYWVIPQRRREREKECRSQFELLRNDSVLVALNRFYWFWVETE